MTIKISEDKFLIGIDLGFKTTNENEKAAIDCGSLWQRFEKEKIHGRIPNKINNEVIAAYYEYEGDHTQPYSYFIGCEVEKGTKVPDGLSSVKIGSGTFRIEVAKGRMPNCIGEAWRKIWKQNGPRKYTVDFEVYGEKSYDWQNAEVDIFLAV
jgi:predicted transcriptional regulator YdeE